MSGQWHLAQAWALVALPLPLLAWWLLPPAPVSAAALRLPFYRALLGSDRAASGGRRWVLLLAVLAWGLLVLAAARPQGLGAPLPLPLAGRDLMLAVDLSGSMREEDMAIGGRRVDRLTAVKAVAGDFIERRIGDRLGLILFGSEAHVQTPLTFDRQTVRTLLFEAEIGLAGPETAIGDAIGLAVKRLRDQPGDEQVLILLTDGDNNAGALTPLRAAELAAAAGIRIHSIGFGGEPPTGLEGFGLHLNRYPMDEATLQALAERTGGRYFRARDVRDLERIYAVLDEIEPVQSAAQTLRPVRELYAWPLAGALLLAALIAAVPTGRGGRLA